MKKLLISILACLCIGATALGVSACSDDEVVQGPQGSQGEQGIQGEQGPQGEKGDKGDAGSDGQDGSDGRDGVDGSDGQDGEDGEDGITPQLKIGTDNYWYVSYDNGVTWISLGVKATGANGQDGQNGQNGSDGADGEDGSDGRDGVDGSDGQDGSDGRDGVDGSDGADGEDGEDGITPQLKIGEDNYWYVSYDNGVTWENLNIKATGSDGATGAPGATGVGIQSITINADGDFVVTYTDGTTQTVVAPNKHTHTYGAWKWYGNGDQTCENRLYYQLCATCGDIAWREGSNDDHKWEATVTTQPTCQAMGYDSKVCEICEKVVKSNYVNSLGHSYVYHEAKAATCTENGWYAYKTCSRAGCGYTTYQTQYSTGHSYTNYIYNEDATCTANGTKTAVCDNGCGATKTLTATNTILAHIYAEGICIRCEALQTQGLRYALNSAKTAYTVTGLGSCSVADVVIPAKYNNLPVTAIGERAFEGESSITSVVIPDSVTAIEMYAFSGCRNLTNITLGNKVESIGILAFEQTNITSINIPASVKKIDSGAFYEQTLDVYVTDLAAWCGIEFGVAGDSTSAFPDEGPNPLTYGGKLYLNGELVTELVIPDTVTEIKSKVFYKYDSLTSVFIPASVTKIGKNAFGGCANLTEIALENDENTDHSKWKIEGYAENRYWSMGGTWETNYYPYEETLVVYSATSLLLSGSKTVQFENNSNDWTLYYASCTWTRMSHGVYKTVVTEATCEDDGYTTYTCNCGKTYITNYVSALGHDYVSHEAQEETCEEVGWAAYVACSHSGCTDTTYVEIPALGHDYVSHEAQEETCEEAGWEAYRTCSRCDYTEYEEISALGHDYETLFTAPTATRDGCTEYTCSICGDNFIENIIPVAFSINGNNRNMVPFEGGYYKGGIVQDFIIPAVFQYDDVWYRVTGIEEEAFGTPNVVYGNKEYDRRVATIVIPDSVTYIDSMAFAFPGREGLMNVVVGSSNKNFVSVDGSLYTKDMKTILLYAYGRTGTTFTIPSGVTTIAAGAFYGANLKTVVIPDTVTIIENYAFTRSYVTYIDIPRSVLFIGYAVFRDTSLDSCELLSTGSWYVTKNEEDWKNKVGGTYVKSTDIKHINTAAQYLRSTYCAYYWYKVV